MLMNERFIIREGGLADVKKIAALERAAFPAPWSEAELRQGLFNDPFARLFVAYDEEKTLLGFLLCQITFNSASLLRLAVRPDKRRLGLGSRLIEAMIASFPKEGDDIVETLTLETRSHDAGALAFYKKNGFIFITSKPHYYPDGEDASYLLRRLI